MAFRSRIAITILLTASAAVSCRNIAMAQTAALSISPPTAEILLSANKKIIQAFTVKNQGETGQFTVNLHAIAPNGPDGHVDVSPVPLEPSTLPLVVTSANRNIAFGEPFTIEGQGTAQIVLGIESPTTDISTDAYFAVVVQKTDGSSTAASTLPAISALVFVTVTPDGLFPISLEIEDFNPPLIHDSSLPLNISAEVKNSASVMIRPEGTLRILSPGGSRIDEIKLFPHLVLAGGTRKLSASSHEENPQPAPLAWDPSWRSIGPHRLILAINTPGGTKIHEVEKTIWIIPVRVTATIIPLVLLLFVLLVRLRRKNQRESSLDSSI